MLYYVVLMSLSAIAWRDDFPQIRHTLKRIIDNNVKIRSGWPEISYQKNNARNETHYLTVFTELHDLPLLGRPLRKKINIF